MLKWKSFILRFVNFRSFLCVKYISTSHINNLFIVDFIFLNWHGIIVINSKSNSELLTEMFQLGFVSFSSSVLQPGIVKSL